MERLTGRRLRIWFAMLEQQKVSAYVRDNFKPDFTRMEKQLAGQALADEINKKR